MPPPYQNLPKNPGCYLFKDSKGSIIYIGKAKNLKKRVAQYFQRTLQTPKTQALLQNIVDIDYYVVCINDKWWEFNCNLDINCSELKGWTILNTSIEGYKNYLIKKV